ncbi:MAG TPA: SulP family inorganic anion transporter [Gallionella sp.]
MDKRLTRFFPFLNWFPLRGDTVRADLVAGITVALVLIPQSMAYAQLAGMPAYYGLYAAFLPGIVAALWGASAQLATGPVAVVALLTASTLAPLAASGSSQFVALAVLMALMVGVIQLSLGAFKLGVVVNFISHPVIAGFTNAAAIIIGLSQLNKLLGVSMGRSEHFINDVWGVLQQAGEAHVPSLLMGLSAFAIMWGMKKYAPRLPGVLIAVVLTTLVSWSTGFEHNSSGSVAEIADAEVRNLANEFARIEAASATLSGRLQAKSAELKQSLRAGEDSAHRTAALNYETELLRLELKDAEGESRRIARSLRKFIFERVPAASGKPARLYLAGQVPGGEQSDGYRWRIRKIQAGNLDLVGGGEVVGDIPAGLPKFDVPALNWDMALALFSGALVISLVGFMEAISIAKAMAAKTRERIDPNQELVGQGLANIAGSLGQAFPVSGSFSRSAVNLDAGARTGLSNVFAGLLVLATLLFLTPLLHHLPQAVLAAVIMMALLGLIDFGAIRHAWRIHRHDGIAAALTFVATLAFSPHLDNGIMAGAGLAILLYLYRTMTPRVAILGRAADGMLRDVKVHHLPVSANVIAMRYDGSLYFANVSYFEDAILEAVANNPRVRHLLIVSSGINQLDASGEEVVRHMVERLRVNGIRVVFSGIKKQVADVMHHSGLYDYIGQANIFADEDMALESIYSEVLRQDPEAPCVLLRDSALRGNWRVGA